MKYKHKLSNNLLTPINGVNEIASRFFLLDESGNKIPTGGTNSDGSISYETRVCGTKYLLAI